MLITLGIIGIVAALTLPSVVTKYREKVIITKLKHTYSLFAQAVDMAQVKYGEIYNWEVPSGNAQAAVDLYFKRITDELELVEDCGNPNVYNFCNNGQRYLSLKGATASVGEISGHQGILKNGVMFAVHVIRNDNSKWWGKYGEISVDINGSKGPNTWGKDVFLFEIRDQTDNWSITGNRPYLYPSGRFSYLEECLGQGNGSTVSGETCTEWVLRHENMDYLHCQEKLSVNGPYSCK